MTELTFHEKIVDIQCRLIAAKNLDNKFGGYKYRSCEGILESLKPLLREHQLQISITDEIVQIADRIYVKANAVICDGEGNSTSTSAFAREQENKKGMDAAQITGAVSSYARKYALNGLLAIDDGKDPDFDEGSNRPRAEAKSEPGVVKDITKKKKRINEICTAINNCSSDIEFKEILDSNKAFVGQMKTELAGSKYEAHLDALVAHFGVAQVKYAQVGQWGFKVREYMSECCEDVSTEDKWNCYENLVIEWASPDVLFKEMRPLSVIQSETASQTIMESMGVTA